MALTIMVKIGRQTPFVSVHKFSNKSNSTASAVQVAVNIQEHHNDDFHLEKKVVNIPGI